MGVYNDGNVYGVYCFTITDDESYHLTILIDKKYTSKMNLAQIEEVRIEYEKIPEDIKKEMRVHFYTSVTTSYDTNNSNTPFITTWPGTHKMLEELFLCGDIRF